MSAEGQGGGPGGAPADELAGLELVAVARVVKVRGVRGEVAAELLTDFPRRFRDLERLAAVDAGGGRRWLALEGSRPHGDRMLLKFAGYDTPEEARALVGLELAVPEAEAVELGEGEYYEWQLKGCRAETIEGRQLGTVREVLHTGAVPVLVIRDDSGGPEHLVPLAASICVEVDTAGRLVRVDAPEGLLEGEG